MTGSDIAVGFGGSVVTEILKYIPALNKNELTRALTAIVVIGLSSFLFNGGWSWTSFANSLVAALVSYKAVVQPVASVSGLKTQ